RARRVGRGAPVGGMSLGHAVGGPTATLERERPAAGGMMIPIPRAGVRKDVRGLDDAKATRHVEDVVISAHLGQEVVPLPEGWQYLGFIFARGEAPADVEDALRIAHSRLRFAID